MQEQETGCGCGTPDRQSLELSAAPASALGGDASPAPNDAPLTHTAERHRIEQAHVPGGEFTMGDATGHRNRGDGETPLHRVAISALDVDVTTVTNADFARFVEDTGYRTEAEWEYTARGGIEGATFPWGEEPIDQPPYRANVWQGEFPRRDTGADGYLTTAPVRSYAPNGYGLWQAVGNVWEWCEDVFHPATYRRGTTAAARTTVTDPTGPEGGGTRVLRGGSYLCHASYCNRYRNAARSRNTPDSSMGNAGFRTVSPRRSTP